MSSVDLHRSHLFAPGANAVILPKALASKADAVVIDLEDALPRQERSDAHALLRSLAASIGGRPTHVRVGIGQGRYQADDVEVAVGVGAEAIRLPKAEDVRAVAAVGAQLDTLDAGVVLHVTIESARGLTVLADLLQVDRVARVVFGERDFMADMGVDEADGLVDHARAQVAIESRAAGLAQPLDGAYIGLEDPEGLRRSCERAKALGFGGKSALHPNQLDIIHDVFTPGTGLVAWAQSVHDEFAAAVRQGRASTVVDGEFVDASVARRAAAILQHRQHGGETP